MSWHAWAEAEADAIRSARRWRKPAIPRRGGSRRKARARRPTGRVVPSNDYLGLTQHPGGDRGRDAGRSLGSRVPARRASSWAPVRSTLRSRKSWPSGSGPTCGPVPHRVRGQSRGHHHLCESRHAGRVRRAEPCVDHRRPSPSRAASRSTGMPTPPTSTSCSRHRTLPRTSSSPRRCSRWTATSHRSTSSPRCVRTTARCSSSTKPTRCSVPIPTTLGASTTCGSAHCRRPSARSAASSPAREFADLLVNRARSYIFTTASTPADSAAALAAVGVVRSPEGTDSAIGCAERRAPAARSPSPIVPVVLGERTRGARCAAAFLDTRNARHRHPTADGAAGYVAYCGWPFGRRTRADAGRPSSRRRALRAAHGPTRRSEPASERPCVFVSGTATEVGKTWWAAATRGLLRDPGDGSPPASRCSRRPGRGHATPRCWPPPPARPGDRLPDATQLRRVGAARWRPASWADPGSPPPTSRAAPVAGRRHVGVVEGVGGPRSPIATTATTSTSRTCSRPTRGGGRRRGPRHHQRGAAVGRRVRRIRPVVALNRFGTDPLHQRNRASRASDGFEWSPPDRSPTDSPGESGQLADRPLRLRS